MARSILVFIFKIWSYFIDLLRNIFFILSSEVDNYQKWYCVVRYKNDNAQIISCLIESQFPCPFGVCGWSSIAEIIDKIIYRFAKFINDIFVNEVARAFRHQLSMSSL